MKADVELEMAAPLVSIVILNYNGKRFLHGCVNSVLKTAYVNFELILVDNGSSDRSVDEIVEVFGKDSRVKVVLNRENLGFAEGNNEGLKVANGEFVVFLNNDTVVTPDWLSALVSTMISDSSIGVCQSKIILMGTNRRLDSVGSFLTPYGFLVHIGLGEEDDGRYNVPMQIFSAKGACMMVRRDLINRIGSFDNAFVSFFEETDFCWRAWLHGFKVYFVPGSIIYHAWGGAITQLDQSRKNKLLIFYGFRNRIASQIKNLGPTSLLKVLPVHIALCSAVAIWYLKSKKTAEAIWVSRALAWNFLSLGTLLPKRRLVQDVRFVSDDILIPEILVRPSLFQLVQLLKGVTWNSLLRERKSTL